MEFVVLIHEPLTNDGWRVADSNLSPDEAGCVMRSWAAKGWRVMAVSAECYEEGWEMNFPAPGHD